MQKLLVDFAAGRGLSLTNQQAECLVKYAQLVWSKKDLLNLTSASGVAELVSRHLCDGLVAAAKIYAMARIKGLTALHLADAGAGAGFIGITLAIALPQAEVTLIESIEKRCSFMNWVLLNAGISNAKIKKVRLGQGTQFAFDFLTERAMGQLPDILEACLGAVKTGGVFLAFQGEHPQTELCNPAACGAALLGVERYSLPCDNKKRHLALFGKHETEV